MYDSDLMFVIQFAVNDIHLYGIYVIFNQLCGSVLKSKGSLFKHVQNHSAAKTSSCDGTVKLRITQM